jgi:SAM-dependent methyltransferase
MNSLMYKSEYAKMYRSEDELWWYTALRHTLIYFIKKYGVQDPYILDAGCGTGKNIAYLTSLGYKNIQGFDYSADAIAYCKQRGLNQVKQGNITAISYPDNTFDVVYCMDVLGSLEVTLGLQAANELYRVLKPGGILICHTAALELFRSQHDNVANIKLRYNKIQFKALLKSNNPEVLKLSYRVFLLSPLVLLFKLAKRITGLFKPEGESASDQLKFPFAVNWVLLKIQLFENYLFTKINLPFGSSIIIVVRKKSNL